MRPVVVVLPSGDTYNLNTVTRTETALAGCVQVRLLDGWFDVLDKPDSEAFMAAWLLFQARPAPLTQSIYLETP